MRAYTHRLIAFAIQCAMITALAFGLSFSAGQSLAQDVTPETPVPSETATVAPTDAPIEQPTVVPTIVPTDLPTEAPTDVPTEQATTEPTSVEPTAVVTDAAITPAPTDSTTLPPPATPVNPDVFTDDFQDGETSGWVLTTGWALADDGGNTVLAASTPNETAMLTGMTWQYYTLSFRVLGSIQLSVAAGGSTYQIKVAADGAAALYKDGVLLAEAVGAPLTDSTAEPTPAWHTVNILAPGNLLAVKVDDLMPISISDPLLLGMGPLVFATDASNVTLAAIDDLNLKRLDAPPPPPTVEAPIGTLPPPTDATAEPTVESTAEATVEATAEVTAEATSEATAEATPEATAEATVEAEGLLSETARKKLPVALVDVLESYVAGDTAGAQAAAVDYFIKTDDQQRIQVTIWAVDEASAATIASSIPTSGGLLTQAFSVQLQALVTLEGLLTLANAPEVGLIEVQPPAVSTSNSTPNMEVTGTSQGTGPTASEGLDTTGATAWHLAGVKGANVGIAIIDTGFSFLSAGSPTVPTSTEHACLATANVQTVGGVLGPQPTDSAHGLNMVQVLCDMAPASKVYMYKGYDVSSLQASITAATSNSAVKVILISIDLGASVSPGDGTGGGVATALYGAITSARTAGKIVIASAGNNTGRYVTLDYSGSGTVAIPMTVYPGDTIHVSWNDWGFVTHSNYPSSLSGVFSQTINSGGNSRASGPPRYSYTITSGNCASVCNETFNISGNLAGVIQIQITGSGTLDATGVPSASSTAGNIARPADSQDVIAVGAVCPDDGVGLPLDSFSSHGPVFANGGGLPTLLASYTRDQVKPDLAGPTHVSVSASAATQQGCNYATGLNGTSAAAAHVAGMAALMVSNTNSNMSRFDVNSATGVDDVQNYLQTHTLDNTTQAGFAVGYDNFYGAGFTTLGSPSYNINLVTAVVVPANQVPASCLAIRYVGLNNPTSSQDGTLTNPYISIAEAIDKSSASECVVVLPGEYVSQIYAGSATATPAVMSYEAATSFSTDPTNLWSTILAPIFISSNDVIVDGFVAQHAAIMTITDTNSLNFGLSVRKETEALRIRTSTDPIIQNSTFTGYKSPGTITDSTGVQIKNSTFSGFAIPNTGTAPLTSPQKNTAILEFSASTGAVVSGNIFQNNTIPTTFNTPNPWQPTLIGIRYSGVFIYNNQFKGNTASSIVGIDQWDGGAGSSNRQSAENRFVGNLFSANTLNGPLIHLFAASNTRFVNNTVVSNIMNALTAYNGYFIFGVASSTASNIDGAFEIHNNLFYNNHNSANTTKPIFVETVENTANIGCDSIDGGVPVRNNWFDPVIGLINGNTLPGECSGAGKIINSIDEPLTLATSFFGTGFDPVHPFRLRPNETANTTLKTGINTGDDQALIAIFGTNPLTGYLAQTDLRGGVRVNLGGNPNPSYQSTHVDIGAYELGTASAPIADPISRTIAEDSSTSVVFSLTATGGYTQTFALSTLPTEYDPSPTNACLGQPVRFTAPNTITYCPPANFHTQYGAGNTHVPVTIGFTVEDRIFKPGELGAGTISLTITPLDDGSPTAPDFNALSDYFTPITQQMSPIVQFGNFTLSGTGGSVDYPFTFAFGAKTSTNNDDLLKAGSASPTTVQVLTTAFTDANSNGGKLILNPVAGQQGFYKFTYTVTDQDGDTGTGNGTIVILPTLAQEGAYDDASFNFIYNGAGWNPSFLTGAYNNTLHSTTTSGNSLELPFTGSVVRFNLRGSAVGNATTNTLKVAFEIDLASGSSSYEDYATTKAALGAGFICVDSLNGQQPNVSSDILNFSATSAAYTFICSGFPSGQVHSIRLTDNLTGAAMTLDRADISAGVMTAGKTYQESSANITYSGTWSQVANPSTLAGAWAFTSQNGASFSFKIDSSVGRILLYRTIYAAGIYGTMNVFLDSNLTTPIATIANNTSPTFKFGQPFLLTIASPGDHTITIKNVGATYSNIDQITTLPIAQSMSAGTYQETYPDLTYSGAWVQAVNAAKVGGTWAYTAEAGASVTFKIDSSVSRIVVYRTVYQSGVYGTMNVYLDGSATPIATINNNTSATVVSGQPFLITIPSPGTHTIKLQNVSATYSGIEQISLLGPIQSLTTAPGTYQENDVNLSYSGKWVQVANTNMIGGAWTYTSEPGASMTFKINNSVSRVVIYRTIYQTGIYGTMSVTVDDAPVGTIINNTAASFQYSQPFIFDVTPGDHTIKIQNIGTTYGGVDQIKLLGALQPLGPGVYQDSDLNLTYTGTWTPSVNASMLGGTRQFTSQANAAVSFKINGSVERMIFYRSLGIGWGTMQVAIDGTPVTPNMINNYASALFGQPFMVEVASPGIHEVTVTNMIDAKFGDVDQITLLGAAQRFTVDSGTLQENNLDLTYKGNWISGANVSALGGSRRFTNENNAEVSFDIDISVKRVMIFRTIYAAGVYGTMNVYLDTDFVTPIATIASNTSSTLKFGQPFLLTIASPGNHTITLRVVSPAGTLYSDLDQITLLPAAGPLTAGVAGKSYQDNYQDITYTGTWTYATNGNVLGNSWHFTSQAGASFSFDIDSTVGRILLYRTVYQTGIYGTMQVFLDGSPTPLATIANNTSTTFLYGQPFVLEIASPGAHTIEVRNIGATYSNIDQIDLLPPANVLTTSPGIYAENDINLTYRGVWKQAQNTQTIGGAWRFTNDPNGSVSFKIDGSVSRVVVYRTIYATGVYGTMQVFLDGSPTALTTIPNNTSTSFLFGQPFVFNIPSPGAHTVMIKNVGATYSGIDQLVLLGPTAPLAVGDYQEDNENLIYTNNWVQAANPATFANGWRYTNDPTATVKFDIDNTVGRVVIYRVTNVAGSYGSMQVFLDTNLTTPIATISNTSATMLYKQPVVVTIANPGAHTITIKNVGATYSDIDQISLLGPAAILGVGDYQESSFDLSYSGSWVQSVNANMLSGAWAFTNTAGSSVSFKVDSTTVKRMIIYRTTNITGVYGTMQVFLNNSPTATATLNNVSASVLFQQPFFLNIPPGTTTVELRNVGATYSGIDQISLLGDPVAISAVGIYQENNPVFTFSGVWTSVKGTEPSGGAAFYTYAPNATVSFKVTGTSFSLYRTLTVGAGTFSVSIDGGLAQSYPTAAASTFWQQPIEFANLTNITHDVVITKTSPATDFIYFDAVRVVSPSAPLTVGQYQETYPGLSYTGTWNQSGESKVSTTNGNTMTFSFTGTGFGIITATPTNGATMRITYTGCTTCNVDLLPTQANLGYSFYNLNLGTYTVTVTLTATGAQGLFIDRIFVLDVPTATLQPGTYEENAAGIVYSPRDLWPSVANTSYSGGTIRRTSQKGAVVQIRFNGNSVFLYQAAAATQTTNLKLCVVNLIDTSGNPIPYCTSFSQNTATTTFIAPVAFYGFGSGVHEIVIENRSQLPFNVDRILVN